ncbi:hypothetical protein Taro_040094 [Colocasia esculenta]|uniref:PROP1-like PPR domain-containing protein n=1 Tax=Colocasia esculenta TaxID=4460 RepID=A0A843WI68_COLES|nr:hypothetical protein [Colocasia esculenta]
MYRASREVSPFLLSSSVRSRLLSPAAAAAAVPPSSSSAPFPSHHLPPLLLHLPTTTSTPWQHSSLFFFSSLPGPSCSPCAPVDDDEFPSPTSGPPSQESVLYVLKMLDKSPPRALDFLNCATARYGFKPGARVYNLILRILAGGKEWSGDFWAVARKMREDGHAVDKGTYLTLLFSFKKQDMPTDASALVQFQSQASEVAMRDRAVRASVEVLSAAEEWHDDIVGEKLEDVKLVLSETTVTKLLGELRYQPMKALRFFRWAVRKPDYKHGSAAYNAMARVLGREGTIREFWSLVEEMRREGNDIDIDTYVKLSRRFQKSKMIEEAVQLYEYMMDGPYKPSIQDCCLLLRQISLADEPDLDLVFRVVKKYEASGHFPSKAVYDGIHRSLASVGNFDEAERILEKMKSAGFDPDNITYSQLIYGLCKARRLAEAREVLDGMQATGCVPDLKTWTVLIQGYCSVGEMDRALTCFTDMIGKGYEADGNLLDIMVKSLCSKQRAGAAYTLVLQMLEMAHLKPWQATYKLLIQKLLGEGKLEEALKLLRLMKGHSFPPFSEPFATYISKYGTIEDAIEFLKTLSPKSSPSASAYLTIFNSFFKEALDGTCIFTGSDGPTARLAQHRHRLNSMIVEGEHPHPWSSSSRSVLYGSKTNLTGGLASSSLAKETMNEHLRGLKPSWQTLAAQFTKRGNTRTT